MPEIGEISRDAKSNQCIWLACLDCGKERWVRLVGNEPRNKLCKACWIKRAGALVLHPGRKKATSGQALHSEGYILIRQPEHPQATKAGYVTQARLMLEAKLGRYLLEGCVPHHINGIKEDDRPENLMELSQSKHMALHWHQRKQAGEAD